MKKTILFLEFSPISGAPQGLLSELSYLHKYYAHEYECVVIGAKNSIFPPFSKPYNFTYYELDVVNPNELTFDSIRPLTKYLRALCVIFYFAIMHNPSIIHCNHYMWSIYGNPIGFLLRRPVIIHLKDVDPLRTKFARILMKCNPRSIYIAVSKYTKSLFVDKYKINKEKTFRIYDGIDHDIFFRIPKENIIQKACNEEKLFVLMSRVVPERDIEIFIDLAALLLRKYSKFKFVHYGYHKYSSAAEHQYFATLQRRVRLLGIQDNFRFCAYERNPIKVSNAFSRAYLSVMPARQFALPNAAIESMMCGTPVIAYRTGGNPEIIKGDTMGKLLDCNSPLLYAEAVESLLNNEDEYIQMALRGAQYADKTFASISNFHKLIQIYKRLNK